FFDWFHQEDTSDVEANAMTVATVDADGYPRSRVVLLKQFSEKGFVFYTNYLSAKGRAIENNPKVCLSFFWPGRERQVIIKGIASRTSESVSDQYFESRPFGSQLGAIVSDQSQVVSSRFELESRLAALESEFSGKPVKRPAHWGGYLVQHLEAEFWQ